MMSTPVAINSAPVASASSPDRGDDVAGPGLEPLEPDGEPVDTITRVHEDGRGPGGRRVVLHRVDAPEAVRPRLVDIRASAEVALDLIQVSSMDGPVEINGWFRWRTTGGYQ